MLKVCVLIFSILLAAGCARISPDQHMDEVHLYQASTKETQKEIEAGKKIIGQCKSLSPKQKNKLLKLHEKNAVESNELEQDLTRTKLILIKTLLEPKVDTKIAGMVRKEIKRLEKLKTEKTLQTYDQAQQIITPLKDIQTRKKLYQAFMLKGGQHY